MNSRAVSRLRASLRLAVPPSLIACLFVAGCSSPVAATRSDQADQRALVATEREQMEAVAPPSKSRYMAVHSYDGWENPYLTVQPAMVTIHLLRADANTSSFGVGGMLRPLGARREDLSVSPGQLGEAIAAIPQSSWPYGRVVAVEEAHKTPTSQEPIVRRNLEATVGTLNDLGIVAYDLVEGNLR